jgi:hypothetical protein
MIFWYQLAMGNYTTVDPLKIRPEDIGESKPCGCENWKNFEQQTIFP